MRMAIGAAAILVTLGVIIWIMSAVTLPMTKQALDVREEVTPKLEQIAGQTTAGVRAVDTISVKADRSQGRMTGVIVTKLMPGGAMEQYFGLREGDKIVEIGPLLVRDMESASAVKDHLSYEYQRSGQITIVRDEQKMTLPAAPTAPAAANADGASDAANKTGSTTIEQQLDAIETLPGIR